jgi:flagellar basal body P-ring protein FlgI
MILIKEEKEQLTLKLTLENKNYRTIVKIAHILLKDIGRIIRKFNNEEIKHKNKTPSVTLKLFKCLMMAIAEGCRHCVEFRIF